MVIHAKFIHVDVERSSNVDDTTATNKQNTFYVY